MRTRYCSVTSTAAVATAWSTPVLITAAMVCPPVLLAIPAAGVAVGLHSRSKRKAIQATRAADAQYLEDAWARWSKLDPTSPRGY